MRILIQTWGTEGDLRPFLALGQALQARGHIVDLLFTGVEGKDYSALTKTAGIATRFVAEDYFVRHREALTQKSREGFRAGNPAQQLNLILRDLMDPVVDEMTAQARALAREADVVVGHFLAHSAAAAAEERALPFVQLALQPFYTTAQHPPAGAPDLGRFMHPVLWAAANYMMKSILLPRVNHSRALSGLSPLKHFTPALLGNPAKVLVAVSESLYPRPTDWPDAIAVSGFLNLGEPAAAWTPEPELARFLAEGPPVFLSFGSMLSVGPDTLTEESVKVFAEALKLAGARGVVQAPRGAIQRAPKHESVCYIERAPHAQLFPQCSAIVHHGGAGTTQSALLAGRASIVVPHVADQFYWADLLHRRGVAAKPLLRSKLAAKPLAERLGAVLNDASMAPRAEAFAEQLRAESGAERAAQLIEACVRSRA